MGEAFWRFSLTFYSQPGVAEALLRLQDRDGADVNLILFALWCGAVLRRRLGRGELAGSAATAVPVQETAATLRELRRCLRPSADAELQGLRRRLAALELAAERVTQQRLAASLPPGSDAGDPIAAAEANLALYLGPDRAARADCAGLRDALARLVRG